MDEYSCTWEEENRVNPDVVDCVVAHVTEAALHNTFLSPQHALEFECRTLRLFFTEAKFAAHLEAITARLLWEQVKQAA